MKVVELELSDAQRNIEATLHWLAETKVRPRSIEADRACRVPDDLLLELQALGVTSALATSAEVERSTAGDAGHEARGAKEALRTAVIAAEALAWGDASVVLSLPGPGLGAAPVRSTGTPEQQARLFAPFARGHELRWGAYALTEPGAGSDVAAIGTTAVKDGHHYVLNGRKCYITNGARADWTVIFATVDPSRGRAGHRAFVVEKGTPGLSVVRLEEKMGLRASETATLELEECRVHVDDLLGGERAYEDPSRSGLTTATKAVDAARPVVAAMAVGTGRAALERAQSFAKEAYMLSRPLPRHAAVRALLGRSERRLHAARTLVWKAASMADEGLPNTMEASMAKAFAAEVAQQVTIDALEVMGAAGNRRDALVEKWFRDAKVYDIFEGTGQIQRVVIAKRLFESIKAH